MTDKAVATRIADLEDENRQLRTRLEQLEKQQKLAAKASKSIGRIGIWIVAGPKLSASSRAWFEKLSNIENPRELASRETADLVTAIVERTVRVGVFGLFVAALPTVLLLWQNFLIREQNVTVQKQVEQQSSDTLIVRRAQLLATIYDEECDDSGSSRSESERSEVVLSDIEPGQTSETIVADNASEHDNLANDVCRPKAHPRARQEAVLAFCEIERSRGVSANLKYSNLERLDFSYGDLRKADLRGSRLSKANLHKADLSGALLRDTNLSSANLFWSTLQEADLSNAALVETQFGAADLSGAILRAADLRSAILKGAKLDGVNLKLANLTKVALIGANLTSADLRDAYLREADLTRANLTETDLSGADLSGANLGGASYLTQEQIQSAKGNHTTIIPEILDRPLSWQEN